MKFSRLAEQQILKAQRSGDMDNLKGAGKPLGDTVKSDSVEAFGFGAMKDAGVVPEEIKLRKAVATKFEELNAISDPAERKKVMSELADLQLKLGIQEDARRKYMG